MSTKAEQTVARLQETRERLASIDTFRRRLQVGGYSVQIEAAPLRRLLFKRRYDEVADQVSPAITAEFEAFLIHRSSELRIEIAEIEATLAKMEG